MIDLAQTLLRYDLGYLRIIAELWGVELHIPSEEESAQKRASQQLVQALIQPELAHEIVEALPLDARLAIDDLVHSGGSMPWSLFTRRYGAVREMGAARRDRELPHRNPVSSAETLWYRAIIGRVFQDTPSGLQEFAYIPSDLIPVLPLSGRSPASPPGRKALPKEHSSLIQVRDAVLDQACTLLAALRMGLAFDSKEFLDGAWMAHTSNSPDPYTLQSLLACADIVDAQTGIPHVENTRRFLEASRGQALTLLVQAWLTSRSFNELRLLPGLRVEGNWQNDPLRAREAVLQFLSPLQKDIWWSLNAFVEAVKQTHPDFQRPAGDYDSWYLYDVNTQSFLRGFEYWDRVDGALLRYLITGPLHWLGILDLASAKPGSPPTAFRLSPWATYLLKGDPVEGLAEENETLRISSDARLRAPSQVPRPVRYQVARFSRWEKATEQDYAYRITDASLKRAREQGLSIPHLLSLLRRQALTVPPSLAKALERWEVNGSEVKIEQALILRLRTPEMLKELRASRAARFLGDPLGPTVIIVKAGAWEKVIGVLAELGYLAEGDSGTR
jgi:Helicase conserved C-terminal domain